MPMYVAQLYDLNLKLLLVSVVFLNYHMALALILETKGHFTIMCWEDKYPAEQLQDLFL